MTQSIEIYFNDLTLEKQQEIKNRGLYDENMDISPLAIVEIEEQGD